MSDALLSPAVGISFWTGTLASIAYASRKLRDAIDDRMIPLMGVLGAFIFAAQMINFTIPGTGSSGHLGGGMILAVLLGPYAALLVMASVLTVQAFFFADGGLLALGCNIWNLGIYPCFIAYPLVYRPIAGNGDRPARILAAAIAGGILGLQMGAFSVVVQTLLSGRSELPFSTFALLMQPVHLAIGIGEGLITAGVINYVRSVRPELLNGTAAARKQDTPHSLRRVLVPFAVIAVLAGGVLSWFASNRPDALEWSIAQITGKDGLPEQQQGIAPELKNIQERTAVLPDYNFRKEHADQRPAGEGPGAWPNIDAGTSLSGLAGAGIVLVCAILIGFGIRSFRRRRL